tara:strand:- start:36 stop:416 length:381 start_codon:yes stop_codon:yes gene_type:complete
MYYLRFFTISLIISLLTLKGFSQADGFFGGNEMDFLMNKKPAKLIIFTADWCGPCKAAKKAMQQDINLKRMLDSYEVVRYDFDLAMPMRRKYNVKKVPTFIIVTEDEEVKRQVGFSSIDKLKNFLD